MKTLKTSFNTITRFFLVLTLLQSCVAYQKTPVSLLQAEQSKKRVKMKNSADQTYKFKQIVLEEEQFYGLKKEKGELVKIAINNSAATEVFLHSKSKSTLVTMGLILVPLVGLKILGRTMTFDSGLEF